MFSYITTGPMCNFITSIIRKERACYCDEGGKIDLTYCIGWSYVPAIDVSGVPVFGRAGVVLNGIGSYPSAL
jgi:hypothetical protein